MQSNSCLNRVRTVYMHLLIFKPNSTCVWLCVYFLIVHFFVAKINIKQFSLEIYNQIIETHFWYHLNIIHKHGQQIKLKKKMCNVMNSFGELGTCMWHLKNIHLAKIQI